MDVPIPSPPAQAGLSPSITASRPPTVETLGCLSTPSPGRPGSRRWPGFAPEARQGPPWTGSRSNNLAVKIITARSHAFSLRSVAHPSRVLLRGKYDGVRCPERSKSQVKSGLTRDSADAIHFRGHVLFVCGFYE
ncbi:hypothetical protein LX36DRAFT_439162 [Colletotrichum falcatum]|nr:hypothetical protein LX36DRAFT_439162 [Colletotrichum falcatum]